MDYRDKTEASPTLISSSSSSSSSSSPSSEDDNSDNDYPPLDLALLEAKVAALGLSRYTAYPSALKGRRCLNSTSSSSSYSSSEEDEDDVFMVISQDGKNQRRPPMLRSKSMKTGYVKPETRKKKVVRFADSLGFDFEYIRLISQDELPIIPKSAYRHLKLSVNEKNHFFKEDNQ